MQVEPISKQMCAVTGIWNLALKTDWESCTLLTLLCTSSHLTINNTMCYPIWAWETNVYRLSQLTWLPPTILPYWGYQMLHCLILPNLSFNYITLFCNTTVLNIIYCLYRRQYLVELKNIFFGNCLKMSNFNVIWKQCQARQNSDHVNWLQEVKRRTI